MSLDKFRKLKAGLFIPKATLFSDWWEGLIPYVDAIDLTPKADDDFKMLRSYMEWLYISCWTKVKEESYAMWKIYGEWKDGNPQFTPAVCIRVDLDCLSNVINNYLLLNDYYGDWYPVDYLKPPQLNREGGLPSKAHKLGLGGFVSHPDKHILYQVGCMTRKHITYNFEDEYRLIIAPKNLPLVDVKDNRYKVPNHEMGVSIPLCNEIDVVKNITLSPFAPSSSWDEVAALCNDVGWNVGIERSTLELGLSWKDLKAWT